MTAQDGRRRLCGSVVAQGIQSIRLARRLILRSIFGRRPCHDETVNALAQRGLDESGSGDDVGLQRTIEIVLERIGTECRKVEDPLWTDIGQQRPPRADRRDRGSAGHAAQRSHRGASIPVRESGPSGRHVHQRSVAGQIRADEASPTRDEHASGGDRHRRNRSARSDLKDPHPSASAGSGALDDIRRTALDLVVDVRQVGADDAQAGNWMPPRNRMRTITVVNPRGTRSGRKSRTTISRAMPDGDFRRPSRSPGP